MIELKEKAGIYAEENVINVLKEAFAKVYADGYRDGYKDKENEPQTISHDIKLNSAELAKSIDGKRHYSPENKTTDVIILSCREIRKCGTSQHLVELTFIKDLHLANMKSTLLYAAEVNTPHYRFTIDLMQRYKGNQQVLTNGIYDSKKAMSLCNQEFHHLTKTSLDCELYDFTINELTDGQHEFLYNSHGVPYYTYHYADRVHNRDIAKKNCSQYIYDLIKKGIYSI